MPKDKEKVEPPKQETTTTTTKPEDVPSLNLDITNMDSNQINKVKEFAEKLQEYLSPEEQAYYRDKRIKNSKIQDEKVDKLEKQLEEAAVQERFEIPLGSNNYYNFIGYDSEQYVEIMALANEADAIPMKERGDKKYLELEVKLYKMMIRYSLNNITEDAINKIPYRLLAWYYRLFKKKNEEPLPFGQKK